MDVGFGAKKLRLKVMTDTFVDSGDTAMVIPLTALALTMVTVTLSGDGRYTAARWGYRRAAPTSVRRNTISSHCAALLRLK
jgi:hypothetical protein